MKQTELRIGNYVKKLIDEIHGNEGSVVVDVDSRILESIEFGGTGWAYHPIPLTEQWLKDFGIGREYDWQDYSILFTDSDNKQITISIQPHNQIITIEVTDHWSGSTTIPCEYVHTFQNIIFALTGKELTK